jgi:hypothetical protein
MSGSAGSSKNSNTSHEVYDGTTSSTTMPVIPEWWNTNNQALGNLLGGSGLTSQQQGGIGALQNLMPGQNAYTQAGYYGLDMFNDRFGGGWATPGAVKAPEVSARDVRSGDVSADQVSAQAGADFMAAYRNPWDRDVIDASLSDYTANVDRTANAMRAGRDAAGAFGDRAAIADAVFQGDAARGLGSLASGLRQQGFNTAAGFGQQDAGRALQAAGMNQSANLQAAGMNQASHLQAAGMNQSTDLQAALANAANALGAQQFNNSLTNERQQFDINTALQGDQNRMQAYRDMQANILAQSGVSQTGIDNLLAHLNAGTAAFGSQSDGTASGSSRSTSSGKTKSKGGGF